MKSVQRLRMVNIYVLKLKSGKYYVGKTNHTFQRFSQHQTGSGAKWTKKYPVVDLFAFHHGMKDSDENKITIQMMKKYGVKNVRGGSWTKVNMTQNEINKLESKIKKRRTVKRKKSKSCSRCGRSSHTVSPVHAVGNSGSSKGKYQRSSITVSSRLSKLVLVFRWTSRYSTGKGEGSTDFLGSNR